MKSKIKFLLAAIMLLAGTTNARAQALINGDEIDISEDVGTLSSDMTCTYFDVRTYATLNVDQGVTLTLNCGGHDFNLYNNSVIFLFGTMTGSVSGNPQWGNESYILVHLSDGAKYTVAGLECEQGDSYLRYYGYDAGTDGHGTVTVTDGPTTVTASTVGIKTTTYTFTATPASGYRFVNWTKGAGGEVLGTAASIAVSCEQNGQYQVYANFEEDVPATPQTETLLTTITATAQEQASYSTANVATVSFSYISGGGSDYLANWGWYGYGWIATVNAAEGYTITKCVFYDDANRTATDSEAPFVVETTETDKTPRINGTPIDGGNSQSKGLKKIEVYGYVTPAGPQVRTLTGVPQGWQVQAGDPLTGVDSNADGSYSIAAGQPVQLVPSAEDKPLVKSVTLEEVPSAVLVTALTLNKTATTISAGQTETLSVATVTPDDATDQTVTWSSDNEAVATVNATTGEVTAVAFGTANITATANDGSGVTATCTVTVTPAIITVTWNNNDITGTYGYSFTKDGVTITAGMIDFNDKNFMDGGTFSTTLGNFTKIEVTTGYCGASGTGWSGSGQSGTWTGNASSVSFSGDIMGMGIGNTKLVFTIEPTN